MKLANEHSNQEVTSQTLQDDFTFQKSKIDGLEYSIKKEDFCGQIFESLVIKVDNMIIDCETGFTQFNIPFENDEAVCWDCGKQRYICVYLHGWKTRTCHFSEYCKS